MRSLAIDLAGKLVHWTRDTLAMGLFLAGTSTVAYAHCNDPGVPELDPASLTSAVSLLVGGALVLSDKLRRK